MNATPCEKLIPLSAVPALPWLPRKPHLATVYRWVQNGIKGVKLQAVRSVGGLCTTEGWLSAYFERLAGADPQVSRTPTQRRKSHEQAERALDEAGIN